MFNNETLEYQDDGSTTIDFEEPFVFKYLINCPPLIFKLLDPSFFFSLRIQCDEDGWALTVNDEPPYPTFFHPFSPSLVQNLMIKGKIEISYIGFGSKSMMITNYYSYIYILFLDIASAPPVNFNLTFVCPEGQVFSQDWFAVPFVFMTCKVITQYNSL